MGFRRSLVCLLATLTALVSTTALTLPVAAADVLTVSRDALRTGWDGSEPGLTAQPVTSDGFGQLFAQHLDGQIYAQPVVAGGTLVAATEKDQVYGLDPATGDIRWHTSVGLAWPTTAATCADLRPNAGVTSTPVVADGVVYLTAKTWDGTDPTTPTWWMHALDAATGAERDGWPVAIAGAPVNDPTHPFQPQMQLQRAGLLIMGGVVYAAFASHCDNTPTRGYVVGVRTTGTPAVTTMWTSAPSDPVNGQTGIWMSGSGIMSDGDGRMFVATGNGDAPPYDAAAAGLTRFGDSVVRLDVQPDGSLQPGDYFAPAAADNLEIYDRDFGSGGVVGLPDSFGTPSHPHLAVVAGKDGRFFLLDRDHLGGRSHLDTDGRAVGVYGPYRGQFSHAAAWPGDGGWVYTTESGGPLRAWHSGVDGAGDPVLSVAGASAATMPFGSGSPVVTSAGEDDTEALVWVVNGSSTVEPTGSLQAYDALPDATGVLPLRWSAPIGNAGKFSVAATDAGRVYVGTRGDDESGVLYGFGRTAALPVSAPSWHAGAVAVGQQVSGAVTVTVPAAGPAMRMLDVGVVSGPFTVDASALPADPVKPGDSVQIPVTFAPTAAGGNRGVIQLHVEDADEAAPAAASPVTSAVTVDVTGDAVPSGLLARPAAVDLGNAPREASKTVAVELRNPGSDALSLTALEATGGFGIVGAPSLPASVPAGGSVAVRVTVVPTSLGPLAGMLTATAGGVSTSVPLTAVGTPAIGRLSVEAQPLPAITAVGSSSTMTVRFTNVGLGPLTVTDAALTGGDFSASPDFATGVQLDPDETVDETMTFRPRAPGPQSATFRFLTTSGGKPGGVVLTGYGSGTLTRLDTSTWPAGGRASIRAHLATLTPLARNAAGLSLIHI